MFQNLINQQFKIIIFAQLILQQIRSNKKKVK